MFEHWHQGVDDIVDLGAELAVGQVQLLDRRFLILKSGHIDVARLEKKSSFAWVAIKALSVDP